MRFTNQSTPKRFCICRNLWKAKGLATTARIHGLRLLRALAQAQGQVTWRCLHDLGAELAVHTLASYIIFQSTSCPQLLSSPF